MRETIAALAHAVRHVANCDPATHCGQCIAAVALADTISPEAVPEPKRVIEGCRHSRQRMIKWVDEGGCPICLTATLGMRSEAEAERDKARRERDHLRGMGRPPDTTWQEELDAALAETARLRELLRRRLDDAGWLPEDAEDWRAEARAACASIESRHA